MTARVSASVLLIALGGAAAWAVGAQGEPIPRGDSPTVYRTVTETVRARYQGHSAGFYAWRLRQRTRQRDHALLGLARARHTIRRAQRQRWAPTVDYAISLASRVYGVPESKMRSVAYCESTMNPFATNGRYRGLFQLGWSPFGLSPYDPVANALSAAQTVSRDGSWRQWSCG